MASGAASQPYCCQFLLCHRFIFLLATNSLTILGFFINCPCTAALGHKAPVGHTLTHLLHEVHVVDSPQGVSKSDMILTSIPRFLIPQLWAPSTSEQTRTQRV